MLAGISAAVPAGPSGSPMSPAESTSAASEPSAWPSCPPKRAPPSVFTIDCIGPSWERISSGTRSLMAATIRPATGSHSLRQTGRVAATQRPRLHASMPVIPDGSALTGSSHRSARRSASWTLLCSTSVTRGSPGGRSASSSAAAASSAAGGSNPGTLKPIPVPGATPAGPVPVRLVIATCRARSQFTGPPSPPPENSCWSCPRNCCICAGSLGSGIPPGIAKPNGTSGT